ncbi:MAG: hypothetical protein N3B13_09535, partial [Deltaproteobacteria bacterium]|nr:hypothetical protein [Deltaproteobacteria bacterium]
WSISDNLKLRQLFVTASEYLKKNGQSAIRIIGEEYIKRPDRIFSLLEQTGLKNIEVILTLRPEIITESSSHFEDALRIASKNRNRLILCSVGIESFYDKDLILFNRCLRSKGILKSISEIYRLKEKFSESLVTDRYELFSFIIFHPYTTMESIEYNLKMMNATGISRVTKERFLNRLAAEPYSAIYHLIKKDGLLLKKSRWKFRDSRVAQFYQRLDSLNTGFFKTAELLCLLKEYR